MKLAHAAFFFALLPALPASAFELKNPKSEESRLKIELDPGPAQLQQDFDAYVRDLATAARRDVDSPPEKKDRVKELQAKALNPVVLFRW